MHRSVYIHYSDLVSTPVFTQRGYLQMQGCHALAGLAVSNPLFSAGSPFASPHPDDWHMKMARFWSALAIGVNAPTAGYQTSYELRLHRSRHEGDPVKTSIWVKTFACDDLQAAMVVESQVDTIAHLFPSPASLALIETETEFNSYWGEEDLQWLLEVRRPASRRIRNQEEAEMYASMPHGDWSFSLTGWREVWDLFSRLPGKLWFSVGVCPTVLFLGEAGEFQERVEIAQDSNEAFYWQSKLNRLLTRAFLVRIRIGGDEYPTQVFARFVASTLSDPSGEGGIAEQTGSYPVLASTIVTPESILDWDKARSNWRWGDFLDWGNGIDEFTLPVHLARLPYLNDALETAVLAGVWV